MDAAGAAIRDADANRWNLRNRPAVRENGNAKESAKDRVKDRVKENAIATAAGNVNRSAIPAPAAIPVLNPASTQDLSIRDAGVTTSNFFAAVQKILIPAA